MDLMMRRNALLACGKEEELYPIGTDIITKYIGRDENGAFIGEQNVDINSQGEFVSGSSYGSPVYLPINSSYRYEKDLYRVYRLTFYDKNYGFISQNTSNKYNNLNRVEITDIPSNAAYIRFVTHSTAVTNWRIVIRRIA